MLLNGIGNIECWLCDFNFDVYYEGTNTPALQKE